MGLSLSALAIVMVFVIPLAALLGSFLIQALKVLKGDPSRRSKNEVAEETRMIQAIYHQLAKMEDRIEALETLLLDRERKEGTE